MKLYNVWYLCNLLWLSAAKDPCPIGWLASEHSGTCLKKYDIKKTFREAVNECKNENAELVIITNEEMNIFIHDNFNLKNDGVGLYYIGINDRLQENHFRWLDYTAEATYTAWSPGQPNNGGPGGSDQDCVILNYVDTTKRVWHDYGCHQSEGFICERFTDCDSTYFGARCSKRCDFNCSSPDTVCLDTNGKCTRVCDGDRKPWCQEECQLGHYGVGCLETCSPNCIGQGNECDRVHGECSHGCKLGYYGVNCLGKCSPHCEGLDNECDKANGECLNGCAAGYIGTICNERCKLGYYGVNCLGKCSPHCGGLDNECDKANGECLNGCAAGYIGTICNETTTDRAGNKSDNSGLIAFCIIVLILGLLALTLLYVFVSPHKKNAGDEQSNQPESERRSTDAGKDENNEQSNEEEK